MIMVPRNLIMGKRKVIMGPSNVNRYWWNANRGLQFNYWSVECE